MAEENQPSEQAAKRPYKRRDMPVADGSETFAEVAFQVFSWLERVTPEERCKIIAAADVLFDMKGET